MPYILYKSNGRKLVTVEDGSIDQSTDLVFVGKNYAGYGQILNQNLVKLLENFANTSPPSKPLIGQTWYDSANKKLKFYDGSKFRNISGAETSVITPTGLTKGDFWYDELNNKLYISTGTGFLFIGPTVFGQESTVSVNGVLAVANNDNTYYVLENDINGNIVATASGSEFVPKNTDPLSPEYEIIKQGLSLPYANKTTGESASNGYYFWGSAAHALRLGNYAANEYQLKSDFNSALQNGFNVLNDFGVLVGTNSVFRMHANSSLNEAKLSAVNGTSISFNLLYPNITSGTLTNIISIIGNKVIPNSSALNVDIGSTSNKFTNIYASKFSGGNSGTSVTFEGATILNGTLSAVGPITASSITAGSSTTNATLTGVWAVNGSINVSGSLSKVGLYGRDNNSQSYDSYVDGNIYKIYSSTAAADLFKLNSSGDVAIVRNFVAGGNVTAFGSFASFSDSRLKSNVNTITNALDKTLKLRGVSYTKDNKQSIGVIAQEVQQVIPEVVDDGEYLSVQYGNLVGLLIEAIKELKIEIDELKSKIK